MQPLFINIKNGDYQMPQTKLNDYYKDYTDYYKKADNEDILLKYLECRPNAIILISTSDLEKTLEDGGLYKKMIKIDSDNMWGNIQKQMLNINLDKIIDKKPNKLYLYWLESDVLNIGKTKCIKNDTFEELVYYSRMFLNTNTLNLYRRQLPLKDTKCSDVWDEFVAKYRKLSLLEQNNVVIMSGMVLYLNNIRTCRDLDMLYIKKLELNDSGNYDIKRVEIGENWRIRLYRKTIKRGDILVNSLYYHYYDGVKIITMDVEMGLRGLRVNRPRAFVDMIMVNLKMTQKYKLPRVKMDGEELEDFYKKMQTAFKKRYNKRYSIEEIKILVNKYK